MCGDGGVCTADRRDDRSGRTDAVCRTSGGPRSISSGTTGDCLPLASDLSNCR
jgi:hypothetical protein